MKNKKMMGVAFVFLLSMLGPSYFVWANDDEYENERHEEHDQNEGEHKYREEDDKQEYKYEGDGENRQQAPVESIPTTATTWDVWSRKVDTNEGALPFDIAKTVKLENQDGKQIDSYVIPTKGEIMIPAVKTAELVGATVHYYKTTQIAEIQLELIQLIVKSGSNAVYENDIKTPMPAEAMMYQEELYIPISVLTNGLGYTVTWDETTQTFLVQQ